MSKKIINETEYYRDQFNPTFHPLVYKMINAMTLQASAFQKQLDPFYDKFLIETYHHDLCRHVEEVEGGFGDLRALGCHAKSWARPADKMREPEKWRPLSCRTR